MENKKSSKKKRPRWATDVASGKKTVQTIAVSMIKYMELAKSSRMLLEATNRKNNKLDFRLYTEIMYIEGALEHMFKLPKSFVENVIYHLRYDKEAWEKDVKDYCHAISPEKSLVAVDNMELEMQKIISRDKMNKAKSKGGIIL